MDTCHFEIDNVSDLIVFDKHDGFNQFVTEFMDKRLEATSTSENMFRKIALNGSYGYDIMNAESYTKWRVVP
jgi:hypothetical protein